MSLLISCGVGQTLYEDYSVIYFVLLVVLGIEPVTSNYSARRRNHHGATLLLLFFLFLETVILHRPGCLYARP